MRVPRFLPSSSSSSHMSSSSSSSLGAPPSPSGGAFVFDFMVVHVDRRFDQEVLATVSISERALQNAISIRISTRFKFIFFFGGGIIFVKLSPLQKISSVLAFFSRKFPSHLSFASIAHLQLHAAVVRLAHKQLEALEAAALAPPPNREHIARAARRIGPLRFPRLVFPLLRPRTLVPFFPPRSLPSRRTPLVAKAGLQPRGGRG
jgi:hypothetical protein